MTYLYVLDEYRELWNTISPTMRKKRFIEMYESKSGKSCPVLKKDNLIQINALLEYTQLEMERIKYITPKDIIYKKSIPKIHYQPIIINLPNKWVNVSSNCFCVPEYTNEHSKLRNGIFSVNLGLLHKMRNYHEKEHFIKHLKFRARLAILHSSTLHNYNIQQISDKPIEHNFSRLNYYDSTVQWMYTIENAVITNNNNINIVKEPNNIIKLSDLQVYYNTATDNIVHTVSCPVIPVNYTGGLFTGKIDPLVSLIASNPCKLKIFEHPQYSSATLIFTEAHLVNKWLSVNKNNINPYMKITTITTFSDIEYMDLTNADIVIVSYQMLLDKRFNKSILKKYTWYRIIVDEIMELLNNKHPYKLFQFIMDLDRVFNWVSSSTLPSQISNYIDILEFLRINIKISKQLCIDNKYTSTITDTTIIEQVFSMLARSSLKNNMIQPVCIYTEMTSTERNHYNQSRVIYRSNSHENVRKIACNIQASAKQCSISDLPKTIKHKNKAQIITQIKDNIENKVSCSICLDEIQDMSILDTCGHIFCTECINMAILQKDTCPLCRRSITIKNIVEINTERNKINCKLNECIKYITQSKNKKFIVYCEWDEISKYSIGIFNNTQSINALMYTGGIHKRNTIMKQFSTGSVQVLGISNKNKATGIDFSFVDEILFLNKPIIYPIMNKIQPVYFLSKDTIEEFVDTL